MSLELFYLGNYGQFIWAAFIFTFFNLTLLYIKTRKKFIKVEEKFLKEVKQKKTTTIKSKDTKELIPNSPIFKI
jgi:heme exporter protein D